MKIYKTQQEVEKDIKDGVLVINGDARFECSISIDASIIVTNGNVTAENIKAWNIKAWNITARNINARDINAWNITAENVTARDINAWDVTAGDILYYAFFCVYENIKCKSIKAEREVHSLAICLDGKLEIKKDKKETIKIGDKEYDKDEFEQAVKDLKIIN